MDLNYNIVDEALAVTIGGQKFAVGLNWIAAGSDGGSDSRAKEAAAEAGHELFCVTVTNRSYGSTSYSEGITKGTPSLGGTFANSIREEAVSVIGLFDLPDGSFYFIAVKAGSILATSDKAFTKDKDALDAFVQMYNSGDGSWDTVYFPEGLKELDLGSVDTSPIEDVIAGARRCQLRSVSSTGDVLKYGLVVVAVLGLAYLGHMAWQAHEDSVAAEQAANLERLRQQIAAEQVAKMMSSPPFAGTPEFQNMVEHCYASMNSNIQAVPGWSLTSAVCVPAAGGQGNVTLTFNRDGGRIAWLHAAYPSVPVQWDNSDKASIVFGFDQVPTISGATKAIANLSWQTSWIASRLDEIFTTYSITQGAPPPPLPPNAPKDFAQPYWPSVNIEMKAEHPLMPEATILNRIPTMMFKSLALDATANAWTLDATMYGPVVYLKGPNQ